MSFKGGPASSAWRWAAARIRRLRPLRAALQSPCRWLAHLILHRVDPELLAMLSNCDPAKEVSTGLKAALFCPC